MVCHVSGAMVGHSVCLLYLIHVFLDKVNIKYLPLSKSGHKYDVKSTVSVTRAFSRICECFFVVLMIRNLQVKL